MRLLYRGASDHSALVKRFEDHEIEAALDAGWRLHRSKDAESEPEEPGSDGPNSPEAQIPRDAEGKRLDGPTLEVYTAAGYKPEGYPPSDYAEVPSEGLTAFREAQAAAAKAAEDAPDPANAPESDDAPDTSDPPAEGDARPEDPEPTHNQRRKTRR